MYQSGESTFNRSSTRSVAAAIKMGKCTINRSSIRGVANRSMQHEPKQTSNTGGHHPNKLIPDHSAIEYPSIALAQSLSVLGRQEERAELGAGGRGHQPEVAIPPHPMAGAQRQLQVEDGRALGAGVEEAGFGEPGRSAALRPLSPLSMKSMTMSMTCGTSGGILLGGFNEMASPTSLRPVSLLPCDTSG